MADVDAIAVADAQDAEKANAAGDSADARPETFAKTTTIIVPPPDIKVVVDRTADFVRRVGVAFEKEIQARNAKSKKFHFLRPTNPYHAYYQQRLQFGDQVLEEVDATAPTTAAADAERAAEEAAAAKAEEEAKKKAAKKKKPQTLREKLEGAIRDIKTTSVTPTEAPPKDKFTVATPPMFHQQDIDILKLTAQFVARNGRLFLSGLTAREARNPQFEFLKPTHPLFGFFQQLVDAYAQIIVPHRPLIKAIEERVKTPALFLDDCLQRAKYEKIQRELEARKEVDDEQERVAMGLIDWHHFVVVETISFAKADDDFLPRPRDNIVDINRMLSQQAVEPVPEEDEDMDMDMDVDVEQPVEEAGEEEAAKEEEEDLSQAKKEVYVEPEPELVSRKMLASAREAANASTRFQKCPVCGDNVPVEDLQEHMRIELLDPRWKEKLANQGAKEATSLASNEGIARELKSMAKRRHDVFMTADEQFEAGQNEDPLEIKAQKAWDAQRQAMLAESQKRQAEKPAAAASAPAPAPAAPTPAPAVPAPAPPPRPAVPPPAPPAWPPAGAPAGTGAFVHPSRANPVIAPGGAVPPPQPPPVMQAQMLAQQQALQMQQQARAAAIAAQQQQPTPAPVPAPRPPPVPAPGLIPGMGLPGMPRPGFPSLPAMGGMPMGLPGMPMGMPRPPVQPPPPVAPSPQVSQEPASKKQKTGLEPEQDWAARYPTLTVTVSIPRDAEGSEWGFNDQTITLHQVPSTITVGELKERVSAQVGNMPPNKMKISYNNGTFLNKDTNSLAHHNVGPGTVFVLGVKTRGKKK